MSSIVIDADELAIWGFIISVLGTMISIWTIMLARGISEQIMGSRLSSRLKAIAAKLRSAEAAGNYAHIKTELGVLMDAIESTDGPGGLLLFRDTRTKKLYNAAKEERAAIMPDVRRIDGLLLNYWKIHAEVEL